MGRAAQGLFSQGTAVLAAGDGAGSATGEGAGAAGSLGEDGEMSAVGEEEEPPVTSTPHASTHASIDAPVTR